MDTYIVKPYVVKLLLLFITQMAKKGWLARYRQARNVFATELYSRIRGLKQLSSHSYPPTFWFILDNLLQNIRWFKVKQVHDILLALKFWHNKIIKRGYWNELCDTHLNDDFKLHSWVLNICLLDDSSVFHPNSREFSSNGNFLAKMNVIWKSKTKRK